MTYLFFVYAHCWIETQQLSKHSSYADSTNECFTNTFAVPCPPVLGALGCPAGQYCYGMSTIPAHSFICLNPFDEIILKFSFLTSSYHVYLYICSTTIQATCNAHPNLPNTMPNTVNNKLCRRKIPRPQVRLPLVPKQLSLQDPWVHYNPNYGVPAPTNT